MGKRRQTSVMRQCVKDAGKCELCGSKRNLEAHHIIPVMLGGPDVIENCLCVCDACHARLTPRSLMTKIAIANRKNAIEIAFYEHFNDLADSGVPIDAVDVMDYLDEKVFPLLHQRVGLVLNE